VPASEQKRDPFAYAIWRVVPSVERGEAINVGVVVYCRRRRFLKALVQVDEERLRALAPDLDLAALRTHLDGLVRIADAAPDAGAISGMDQSDRFGFLTAASSTIVQSSPIHTGFCDDPEATLQRLFSRLVV
jgi:hypothetical protein